MSIKIMTAIWDGETLGPSERLVLLSLADHADDHGTCYPSMGRLAKRTGMTVRGVQKLIRSLTEDGYLSVRIGAGINGVNVYRVNPSPEPRSPLNAVPPEQNDTTPPNMVRNTPEPRSPKPSLTIKEPSSNIRAILCEVVSGEVADAFIEYRKAIKAKLTPRAATIIANKLRGNPNADAVVDMAIEKAWRGIYPESFRPPGASAPNNLTAEALTAMMNEALQERRR